MPILTEEERVGTLLAGRYQLDAILGTGGTGVVFEATHGWTGRKVAVKLLKPEYSRDLQLTRRFMQEARAAAGLSHPHVVEVLDMGNEKDGTVHLVLERLEGCSLGRHLEEKRTLTPAETLEILVPIMDALVLAHRQGIIHRDLKPDNIYLHTNGAGRPTPKLLDFGMSKMVDAAWGTATSTGTLVGTPFYMSPEQAEGRKDQGPASDVWSMGVILYRCLTGALPFYAETPTKLLIEIVKAKPKPVLDRAPDVPKELADVVDRCLIDDLDERWQSMDALLDALRSASAANDIPFPALPDADAMEEPEEFDPGPRHDGGASRRKMMLAGLVAATALAALGLVLWASQTTEAAPETETVVAIEDVDPESEPVTDPDVEPSSLDAPEAAPAEATAEAIESATETEPGTSATTEARPTMAERARASMGTLRATMRPSTGSENAADDDTMTTPAATNMRLPEVADEW